MLAKDIYQFRRLAKLVYRKPAKIKITEKQIFLCVVMSITKKKKKPGRKMFPKMQFHAIPDDQ